MKISITLLILGLGLLPAVLASGPQQQQQHQQPPPKRKLPKDPLYISEIDLENLYDEWEEHDDEQLPPDELPPHKRPPAKTSMPVGNNLEQQFKEDPERFMIASKKGKTVMAFVSLAGEPTRQETELLTQRWQVGLNNNHIKCERFLVEDTRAIFVFEDGSLAFEAKEYLLDQPELKEYSIDNRSWHGKGYPVEFPNRNKNENKSDEGVKAKNKVKIGDRVRDEL